jgi:hypothetical protein
LKAVRLAAQMADYSVDNLVARTAVTSAVNSVEWRVVQSARWKVARKAVSMAEHWADRWAGQRADSKAAYLVVTKAVKTAGN